MAFLLVSRNFSRKVHGSSSLLVVLSGARNGNNKSSAKLEAAAQTRQQWNFLAASSWRGYSTSSTSDSRTGLNARSFASAAVDQKDPLDTAFADPNAAFKSKTTWELIRAYLVYMMCSSNYLVEHNMQVHIWSAQIDSWSLSGKATNRGFSQPFVT